MVVRKNATILNIDPAFKSMYLEQGFQEVVEKEKIEETPITSNDELKVSKEDEADESIHYKRSEITLMKVADLKELAKELEIEDADKMSGEKLKEAIIAKLGL